MRKMPIGIQTFENVITDGCAYVDKTEWVYNPANEGKFFFLGRPRRFAKREFSYYWFKTGTPTFLIEQLKHNDFDPLRFASGVTIRANFIDDYRIGGGNPVPLLYQSGHLTIRGYDNELDEYILDFPNAEVRYGFLEELLTYYTYVPSGSDFFAGAFIRALRMGDVEGFMGRIRSFFANMPYNLNDKTERHYQLVFYLVFTLMGHSTRTVHAGGVARRQGARGRGGRDE
jgi:hypothetical protein